MRSRLAAVVSIGVLALPVAGCAGDDDPDVIVERDDDATEGPATPQDEPAPDGSPEDSPSEDESMLD